MSANKPYMKKTSVEYNYFYKSILIARYVKYITVIPNIISRREIFFQFCMRFPFMRLDKFCPAL